MNSERRQTRLILIACLAGLLAIALFLLAVAWANERSRPDYLGYDLSAPKFDGKPWAWFLDMVNMPSLKPQEAGTLQQFPLDSVPRQGVEPHIPLTALREGRPVRDLEPANPVTVTPESLANGRKIYDIYCAACHGLDGKAQTPVVQRGMPAPPIDTLRLVFSEAHLYNKIRFGEPIMPAYGFQTSRRERWDIVNYLKSPEFGK